MTYEKCDTHVPNGSYGLSGRIVEIRNSQQDSLKDETTIRKNLPFYISVALRKVANFKVIFIKNWKMISIKKINLISASSLGSLFRAIPESLREMTFGPEDEPFMTLSECQMIRSLMERE